MDIHVIDRPAATQYVTVLQDGIVIGEGTLVFLSERDGRASALIHAVFVDERHRGRGIGRKIMNEMVRRAKAAGCYKIVLTVRDNNRAAQALYRSVGFCRHSTCFRMDFS